MLDLSECAISEFVDFPEAPHPASHHLQVVAPHLTLQLCCDTEQSMTNWLALLKKSSVNGQDAVVSTTTNPNPKLKGDIIISISLNGDLLSSCPFTPKVSAKLALEKRLNRRSTMEDLQARNILSPAPDASSSPTSAKKEFTRKQSIVELTLADDVGLIKNLEHRQMQEEKQGEPELCPRSASARVNSILSTNLSPHAASLQDFDPPIASGWLHKKGHFRHSWKKRYFFLTTTFDFANEKVRLTYFAKIPSDTSNWKAQERYAKGSITLNGAHLEESKPSHKSKDARFTFKVVDANKKPYEMSADTEQDRKQWLTAIKLAIDFAASRDGHPLPNSTPSLKANQTDSTASMTSAASVLVDLPASYAGVEEVRLLGQTQRQNLDDLISKLKFDLESDPSIASEPTNAKAVAKLTKLWTPSASHPTVRNILSSVSISNVPQQMTLSSCLSRLLEIEASISSEFADDPKAATEAAKMLASQVATGQTKAPPPPAAASTTTRNRGVSLSPADRRKQRRVRPSQRMTLSPGRGLGITGGIGMNSGGSGRGRSPNPKNRTPSPSKDNNKQRRRDSSSGRPSWTEITSPDGSMIYSSPKSNVMRRSSSSEIPFSKRGNRNGVRGNPNFSKSPKSADKERRASIEAQLNGSSPPTNPKLSRKAKSTPPTSADKRRVAFGHRIDSGGHNDDWTHGDIEVHGGSARNVVKGNVLDHIDEKANKPEWDTGRRKKSPNKATTRAELTKNKKTIYSTLHDSKSGGGATLMEGNNRMQISSGNGRKLRSASPKKNIQVQISLHKGVDLEAKDETGTSDPYFKIVPIRKNGEKVKSMGQKSKTKMQTCNPDWEEDFDFTINVADVDHFSCAIKDWNKYSSSQALGTFKLPVSDILKEKGEGKKNAQVLLEGVESGMVIISYRQIRANAEDEEKDEKKEGMEVREEGSSPAVELYQSQKSRRSIVEMAKEAAGIVDDVASSTRPKSASTSRAKSTSPTRSRPDFRSNLLTGDKTLASKDRSVSPGKKKKIYPKSRPQDAGGLGEEVTAGEKGLSLRDSPKSSRKGFAPLQRNKKGFMTISKRTMTYFDKPPSLSASMNTATGVRGKSTYVSPEKRASQAFKDKMSKKLMRTTPGRIETAKAARSARSPSELTGLVSRVAAMKKKNLKPALPPTLEASRSSPGNIETSNGGRVTKRLNRASPTTRSRGESRWQQKFKQDGKTKSFFDLYPNMRKQPRAAPQYQQATSRGQRSIAENAQWGRVVDWLSGIKMGEYEGIFEEQGLTSLSAIELLEEKDLIEMNIKTKDQGLILRAIRSFSQQTNESIVGINQTENLAQWIIGAFDDGNREVFTQLWDSKLPSKLRDKAHFNYAAGKKIAFYCQTYFAVLPILKEEPKGKCEDALAVYGAFCTEVSTTFIASSEEFKAFSSLADAKDVSKVKEDSALEVLFTKDWKEKLRERLETFLTSVEDKESGSPKKDLSLELAAVDDEVGVVVSEEKKQGKVGFVKTAKESKKEEPPPPQGDTREKGKGEGALRFLF